MQIARGLTSEDAAVACGVSGPVGSRWFRHAGGMPPIELAPVSGRYLSFSEREDIAVLRAQGISMRQIAIRIGRSPSTISRELRRNAATRNGKLDYRASTAQWKADLAARRPKAAKLVEHQHLREYVQDKLSGVLRDENGDVVGPFASWKGRNKPRRADRRWATAWSPQQISNRLPIDFPDDESMRISHEAIYQSLYIEGRGALERELVACLRTGRALRKPRARAKKLRTGFITDEVTIGARPDEVDDRATAGHWEGDLIIGLQPLRGRHPRRADQPIHHAATSAAQGRLRHGCGGQERASVVGVWIGIRTRRARGCADTVTEASAQVGDVGPGQGIGASRRVDCGNRNQSLLLRSLQSVATRDERKYQWIAAAILSEGHRPRSL